MRCSCVALAEGRVADDEGALDLVCDGAGVGRPETRSGDERETRKREPRLKAAHRGSFVGGAPRDSKGNLRGLPGDERPFASVTPAVATEDPTVANHPMARNQVRDLVSGDSVSDGPGAPAGHRGARRGSRSRRGFRMRNPQQGFPHLDLEVRSAQQDVKRLARAEVPSRRCVRPAPQSYARLSTMVDALAHCVRSSSRRARLPSSSVSKKASLQTAAVAVAAKQAGPKGGAVEAEYELHSRALALHFARGHRLRAHHQVVQATRATQAYGHRRIRAPCFRRARPSRALC